MTTKEWNTAIKFLMTAEENSFVEHENRTVLVVNMHAGRYLLMDENNEFVGVCREPVLAMAFLKDRYIPS